MPDQDQISGHKASDFELDEECHVLLRDGGAVRLSPKEYQVLCLLAEHSGKAVSRDAIMAAVWPDTVVGDTSLARCISALRRHLGADAIEVVPKFGYRLTLDLGAKPRVSAKITANPEADGTVAPDLQAGKPNSGDPPLLPLDQEPDAGRDQLSGLWRGRRWLWAGLGACAMVLLLAAAPVPLYRILPWAESTGATWTDTQTGLEWQRQDNGYGKPRGQADVTRGDALAYCSALRIAGRSDWRLPTIAELQTLYDTTHSIPGQWGGYRPVYWHAKGNLALSGSETASDLTWLTDVTQAGWEQGYDFSFGGRNYNPTSFRADHRVICVRNLR